MKNPPPPPNDCPSCGRFVGPQPACPYCGAAVGQRLAVRLFKYGSLALALLGLAVLLVAARCSQVPTVEIGSLVGTMNWAYVRLEGTVSRQPAYDPETQALKLWVWDGTGEILVTAYRAEAEALRVAARLPAMGDRLAVEGTLRVKEDFQYLVLNVPQHVEIWPAQPAEMAIAAARAAPLYQSVRIRGLVREVRQPYEGLCILSLRDASGEIDVTLAADTAALGGDLPEVSPGQALQVTGAVDHYRDAPQISVARAGDLVRLDEAPPIASRRRIAELAVADVGRLVQVEGALIAVHPFSAGVKATLADGGGTVTLLLWQDLCDALPEGQRLEKGAVVRVQGELTEYRGALELVPELAADVVLLAHSPGPAAPRRLGDLSAADVGQVVMVEGVLRSWQTFSAGTKGVLDDGSGTVILLLWQDIYETLPEPEALAPGARLRVEGEVAEYRGELEIVPGAVADVHLLGRAEQVAGLGGLTGPTAMAGGAPASPTPSPTASPEPAIATPTATPTPTLEPLPQASATPTATSTLVPTARPTRAPTDSPTPAAETRTIGQITVGDVGGRFTLAQAGIAEQQFFSKGIKLVLSDPGGRITLLIWQNVLEEIPGRYDLVPGSQVRVVGRIDEYQGELEIVPQAGSDVAILRRAERAPIEERSIGVISPSDEGRIFVVAGTVGRVEGNSSGNGWLKLWIQDGSGEILVFVPERAVEYLPTGIGPGTGLRVRGEVDIYQGHLEIIPRAGADVEVP
jgi:DNA/RNA endonuclease YhcR with UshA esterase domain